MPKKLVNLVPAVWIPSLTATTLIARMRMASPIPSIRFSRKAPISASPAIAAMNGSMTMLLNNAPPKAKTVVLRLLRYNKQVVWITIS